MSRYHVTPCRDRTAALEEEKEVDKKMMKSNVGMVFSSFFSPLPIQNVTDHLCALCKGTSPFFKCNSAGREEWMSCKYSSNAFNYGE